MTLNINKIRKQLNKLSREDLEQINAEIAEKLEGYVGLSDFLNGCAEQRFADGLVCPHCGKKHIVKFGKVREKHKNGVYHINALHSKLKLRMKRKYGISTKYIGNYMYWFNWTERNSHISRHRQGKSLIYDSISSMLILTREDIRETKPFKI